MERLWAPWRFPYLAGAEKEEGCFLCRAWTCDDPRSRLVLHRGRGALVIMNLYPYNNGHLMVAPALHAARLADLPEEVRRELMEEVSRWVEIIGRAMRPEGFNVGMNLGAPAGAGLADHLHIHVVPRWGGDTNFMPVTGQVKVISQSLEDAYRTLLDASRSRD